MVKNVYSLVTIEAEKARVRAEIRKVKAQMNQRMDVLFTNPPENNKAQRIAGVMKRTFAIWDGVRTGFKLAKAIGSFLPSRR